MLSLLSHISGIQVEKLAFVPCFDLDTFLRYKVAIATAREDITQRIIANADQYLPRR